MVSSQNSCPLEPQHMTLLGNGVLNVVKIRMVMSLYGIWGGSSAGKESTCNAGNPDLIPESRRSPGEGIGYPLQYSWASLVAQLVQNPPATRETWVPSLGWEDPWSKEWQPTPVFWPGEFHGLYSPWGCKESDMTEWLSLSKSNESVLKIDRNKTDTGEKVMYRVRDAATSQGMSGASGARRDKRNSLLET